MGEMYALLMFPAGFLGNFVCQTTRSLGNISVSSIALASAATQMILGTLMVLGGGRNKGRAHCSRSWTKIKKSIKSLGVGAAQGVGAVTLVTPMLRGAQASSERFVMQGIYSPRAAGTTRFQSVFGLNSWEVEPPKAEPKKTAQKTKAVKPAETHRKTKSRPVDTKMTTKAKRTNKNEPEWGVLVSQYLASRTASDIDRARRRMATKYPLLYLRALKAVRDSRRRQGSGA